MKLIYIALIGLSLSAALTACSDDKKAADPKAPEVPTVDPKGLKIAFYQSDSLNTGFDYLRVQDSILSKKQEKFQKEFESRQRSLQSLGERIVNDREKMLITGADLQKMEEQYKRQEGSLMNYQQSEGTKLQQEAAEMQTVLANKVQEFAKKYCEKYKLDMLIMHAPGGQFTYYNPKMDVTQSFIEFVNAEQQSMEKDMGK